VQVGRVEQERIAPALADRVRDFGKCAFEDSGGLEEAPRPCRRVAEQTEEPTRRASVPSRAGEVDVAEPVEEPVRGRCTIDETSCVEGDDERLVVGRLRDEVDTGVDAQPPTGGPGPR